MSYAINLTNGTSLIPGGLSDGTIDTSHTSLVLIGKDYSGYGQFLNDNFVKLLENFANTSAPTAPLTGQIWYDSGPDNRLKVYNGTAWRSIGSAIVNASSPASSSTVTGDLWLDSGDLENYPALYRYNGSDWVAIDNTDHTSSNGIIFADARINSTGEDTGSTDAADLLVSDYLDPDAPDPALYPRGTLLFNTRVSGFVVRKFMADYLNATDFPNGNERMNSSLPTSTHE